MRLMVLMLRNWLEGKFPKTYALSEYPSESETTK